jgi:hypothetical protein
MVLGKARNFLAFWVGVLRAHCQCGSPENYGNKLV